MAPMSSITSFFLATIFALAISPTIGQENSSLSILSRYPVGDARRCLSVDPDLIRFGVLPGVGWDNLRNLETGIVVAYNFSRCLTTDDGKYLLPDNVHAIPIKHSELEQSGEIMRHWNNFTSTTSKSINANAGLSINSFSISGKYSSEFSSVKERQFYDDSSTVRVQARHHVYTVKLQPDSPLSPEFRARLRKIAAHIVLGKNQTARYESQLLVRDFGTHVLNSIDAGALLSQLDEVSNEYIRKYESSTKVIKSSAGASFGKKFGMDGEKSSTTTDTQLDEYRNNVVYSKVTTNGGPVFSQDNFSAKDWTSGIGRDPVALDRSGLPIYNLITTETLPDVPISIIRRLSASVKASVELYYRHNTYPGCTNRASPNFSYQANIDDGTCVEPQTNFTFGGVYQTCSQSGQVFTDLCSKLEEKNPLTGAYTCPPNFQAVLIQEGKQSTSQTVQHCRKRLFRTKCSTNVETMTASYTAYWCAASVPSIPEGTGLMFGGVHMPTVKNPLTRQSSCPEHFYGLTILKSLTICVSDDYEQGQVNHVPFAGFFTCKSGNPLAVAEVSGPAANQPNSMESFYRSEGTSNFPRKCPLGYSRHLAVVDNGCAINYCVQSGAFSPQALPQITPLPCMEPPREGIVYKYPNGLLLTEDGQSWADDSEAEVLLQRYLEEEGVNCQQLTSGENSDEEDGGALSHGSVAAISIVSTLACSIPLTILVVVLCRNRSK